MSPRAALIALLLPALLLTACGEDDDGSASGSGPRSGERIAVVATTTPATDLTRNVGGDRIELHGLIPANADPHDYEVRPADVQALTDAKLVVKSGGDLDDWLGEAIESAGSKPRVVTLIDHVKTITGHHEHEEEEHGGEEEEEELDPHWWQDPRNAERAVAAIRDALIAADPAGRSTYEANAAAYTRKLQALDTAVAACIDQVPADRRKLVTTHDALGYYAKRYGIEVIGTVIPALTTQGQPSSSDTAKLTRDIESAGVKTIFAESSVNAKVEKAIADAAGAKVGTALYADTLGPEGSDGDTYLKSIGANTKALVDGFSGGSVTCSLPS